MLQIAERLWLWPLSRRGDWMDRPPAALTTFLADRHFCSSSCRPEVSHRVQWGS